MSYIRLGTCKLGHRTGQPYDIAYQDIARHALAVGGTGSGKTVALKRIAECLLADKIPVVAVDVLGDLSGLAIINSPETLNLLNKPPHHAPEDPETARVREALTNTIHPRILTPCSDMCERMALTPVPQRPKKYHEISSADKDYLVLWADNGAGQFLERIGFAPSKPNQPDVVRGIVTDCILEAWEHNEDLSGIEGLKRFGAILEQWNKPPIPEKAIAKIQHGIAALSVGAEALWHKGINFNIEELFATCDPQRTPLVIVNIAHLPRWQHPWIAAQVINSVWSWASSLGPVHGKPRVAIFLDELAGERGHLALLPPANYKSLSGEAIRRILRQGRHYGITLLAGTQSPTDVDANSFINFANRLVGRLVGEEKAKVALQGADMSSNKKEFLLRLLAQAPQGHMFAITPSGGFESVRIHWLATIHDKFTPEQWKIIYEKHIIPPPPQKTKRRASQHISPHLTRIANEFKSILSREDYITIVKIAEKYQSNKHESQTA